MKERNQRQTWGDRLYSRAWIRPRPANSSHSRPFPQKTALALVIALFLTFALAGVGCEGDVTPQDSALQELSSVALPYDTTALVVIVNPLPRPGTSREVASPGTSVQGVYVSTLEGHGEYSDAAGVVILPEVAAPFNRLTFEGNGSSGEFGEVGVNLEESGVTELAVMLNEDGVEVISQLSWSGDDVKRLAPDPEGGIPTATLDQDNQVLLLAAGVYPLDLDIVGDNIRIYGENFDVDWPTIDGTVRVTGNNDQLRGIWIRGNLDVTSDRFAMLYGGVGNGINIDGDNATLLDIMVCDSIEGSGLEVLVASGMELPFNAQCPSL